MSSLHALLVLASEEAETSKTPFYVAGGIFAAFAVLIGAFGLMSRDFPKGDGGTMGVIALAAVLTVAAMATSIITG